jgi:hypothetical protein
MRNLFSAAKSGKARRPNGQSKQSQVDESDNDSEAGLPQVPLLHDSSIRRSPWQSSKKRALLAPQRALETIEPYADLHMDIHSAMELVPSDPSVFSRKGTADPYVIVYVNDEPQATGPSQSSTLNPKWSFRLRLDIYSPLSIVQVRVMDKDRTSKDDIMGFVEFCVADLIPNQEAGGNFELRRPEKLVGKASARVRAHMHCRDADHTGNGNSMLHSSSSNKIPRLNMDSVNGLGKGGLPATPQKNQPLSPRKNQPATPQGTQSATPQPSTPRGISLMPRLNMPLTPRGNQAGTPSSNQANTPRGRLMACFGTSFEKKSASDGEGNAGGNAGEIAIKLYLKAPRAPDDEFYAFCLPRPTFHTYSAMEEFPALDMAAFYQNLVEVKELLYDKLYVSISCCIAYIVAWRCKRLSASILIWWWCACLWPSCFLPTLPLWVSLMLRLLRNETWRMNMLETEIEAPLNDNGLRLVASFRDTQRMLVWLQRLLTAMSGSVKDPRPSQVCSCNLRRQATSSQFQIARETAAQTTLGDLERWLLILSTSPWT